jgi:hypothetical protein
MLLVAVVAVLLVIARPVWRYWFASPIRTIVYQFPGQDRPTTVTFDTRHPAAAKELDRMRSQFDTAGFPYRIERSPVSPDDKFGAPRARPVK